jgi:hypothetical protein
VLFILEVRVMAGRPSKYESHVKPKLLLIEAWARDGLILDDIANNLNIAKSTLCEYQNQYTELSDSLKRGKEEVDIIVENSLFKRALGYDFEEVTQEPLYNPITGEPILDEQGNHKIAVTKIVRKQVVPDTTAQIFWLKNRKSKEWRDRHEVEHSGNMVIFNGESELTD